MEKKKYNKIVDLHWRRYQKYKSFETFSMVFYVVFRHESTNYKVYKVLWIILFQQVSC